MPTTQKRPVTPTRRPSWKIQKASRRLGVVATAQATKRVLAIGSGRAEGPDPVGWRSGADPGPAHGLPGPEGAEQRLRIGRQPAGARILGEGAQRPGDPERLRQPGVEGAERRRV